MCDNCLSTEEHNDDITIPAQMFLSCVKRTGERFGAGHLVDILRGSKSKKVQDFNHQVLSTYGIGKGYSKEIWMKLVRQFVKQRLLINDTESAGVLKLTPEGYSVMKGAVKVMGSMHQDRRSSLSGGSGENYNRGLFEILRERRRELAAEENVPPYVVFSDKTLFEIASKYPQSREALLNIHGIGAHKFEKYGDIIISLIRKYCDENETAGFPENQKTDKKNKIPRYIEIGELYNSGLSIREISGQEKIQERTIMDHLFNNIRDGIAVRNDLLVPLLPSDKKSITAIMEAFDRVGAEKLKPVYDELNGMFDYDTINLCRLYYLGSGEGRN